MICGEEQLLEVFEFFDDLLRLADSAVQILLRQVVEHVLHLFENQLFARTAQGEDQLGSVAGLGGADHVGEAEHALL